MSRNSLTRYTAWHLRIRRLVQFIFVGAIYHNALTICAALLSPRGPSLALWAIHLVPRSAQSKPYVVAERYLALRICRDRGSTLCYPTVKNSSAVPFRSGHMSVICARPSKGKGDSQEGGNRRCLPSCARAASAQIPAAGRAHVPAAVGGALQLRFSENPPSVRGRTACAVRVHQTIAAGKGAARTGRIAAQLACPAWFVLEKKRNSCFCAKKRALPCERAPKVGLWG